MLCSTSVRRNDNRPPPYHDSFSDRLRGRRAPLSDAITYEMAREIANHEPSRDTWAALISTRMENQFPVKNRVGLRTNAYWKKSHPYPIRKIAFRSQGPYSPSQRLNEEQKLNETKRSLLQQFKDLSNHYNSMRQLFSEGGLGDSYGTYEEEDGSDIIVSPGKRMPKPFEEDSGILRLGILDSEDNNNILNFLSHKPWKENT